MRIRLIWFGFSHRSPYAVTMATAWDPNDRAELACVYVCPEVKQPDVTCSVTVSFICQLPECTGSSTCTVTPALMGTELDFQSVLHLIRLKGPPCLSSVWGRVEQFAIRREVVWSEDQRSKDPNCEGSMMEPRC